MAKIKKDKKINCLRKDKKAEKSKPLWMNSTTIPMTPKTRDELGDFKYDNRMPSYDHAIRYLLANVKKYGIKQTKARQ